MSSACVGGGSNAMGIFYAFIDDAAVQLWGVEAAGHGLDAIDTAASLNRGTVRDSPWLAQLRAAG